MFRADRWAWTIVVVAMMGVGVAIASAEDAGTRPAPGDRASRAAPAASAGPSTAPATLTPRPARSPAAAAAPGGAKPLDPKTASQKELLDQLTPRLPDWIALAASGDRLILDHTRWPTAPPPPANLTDAQRLNTIIPTPALTAIGVPDAALGAQRLCGGLAAGPFGAEFTRVHYLGNNSNIRVGLRWDTAGTYLTLYFELTNPETRYLEVTQSAAGALSLLSVDWDHNFAWTLRQRPDGGVSVATIVLRKYERGVTAADAPSMAALLRDHAKECEPVVKAMQRWGLPLPAFDHAASPQSAAVATAPTPAAARALLPAPHLTDPGQLQLFTPAIRNIVSMQFQGLGVGVDRPWSRVVDARANAAAQRSQFRQTYSLNERPMPPASMQMYTDLMLLVHDLTSSVDQTGYGDSNHPAINAAGHTGTGLAASVMMGNHIDASRLDFTVDVNYWEPNSTKFSLDERYGIHDPPPSTSTRPSRRIVLNDYGNNTLQFVMHERRGGEAVVYFQFHGVGVGMIDTTGDRARAAMADSLPALRHDRPDLVDALFAALTAAGFTTPPPPDSPLVTQAALVALRGVDPRDTAAAQRLFRELDSDDFQTRQHAKDELRAHWMLYETTIRAARTGDLSPEQRTALDDLFANEPQPNAATAAALVQGYDLLHDRPYLEHLLASATESDAPLIRAQITRLETAASTRSADH